MASKVLPAVQKLYYIPKPDLFSRGVPSQLPEAYKRFYDEWMAPSSPVHNIPVPGKWKRDPLTGEVWPIQDIPIPVKYPKEANTGIWGGEGVVFGYTREEHRFRQKVPRWWMPTLQKSVVYSEIFDKRLSVIVTKRTINLIIDHHGFDHYILKTSPRDLKSLLALKLKKKMLLALFDKTLYQDDPTRQEQVYNKYKHYLTGVNKEDLEWYGLSVSEAITKFQQMEDSVQPKPLKPQFRAELIEELKTLAANNELDKIVQGTEEKPKTWLSRINPFAAKT